MVGGAPIELKMFVYNDTRNRNVWAVNYITREAYLDGYDYFYRVNDDSAFHTAQWASLLVGRMQELNNFGVVVCFFCVQVVPAFVCAPHGVAALPGHARQGQSAHLYALTCRSTAH